MVSSVRDVERRDLLKDPGKMIFQVVAHGVAEQFRRAAAPIAWWAMNKWLQGFAYRITIQWWMFALAGLLALFIALCTVSFQAVRAAVANPVKSLQSE